jgi:Protein of unknown function (DUF3604)
VRAIERRDFLKVLVAVTGGLAMRPALGSTLGGLTNSTGATRLSRLGSSLFLVHTDLHNHSLISGDALGDPHASLNAIRAAGIDVACMTEHAVSGQGHGQLDCAHWQMGGCRFVEGINANDWQAMAKIADDAYQPGTFVSFRGFEYSTPTVGHVNVWFGRDFTDPAHEGALATPRAISEAWRVFPQTKPVADQFQNAPDTAMIKPFYDWLSKPPGSKPFGGGNDAIASFNHPGYFGNFKTFKYHAGAAPYIVLIEAFNSINGTTATDYFWYGADKGLPNPFNACFNAGWRPGFTGVSDEHSGVYGQAGKGRGGLWVDGLTRDAVRRGMESKRSFATLEAGLRLDATANGVPMGSSLASTSAPVTIALDIDRGPDWAGKVVYVEVIGPGPKGRLPTLLDVKPITVPSPGAPPVSFTVQPNGRWLFLRLMDPDRTSPPQAKPPFDQHGGAFAYASPWYFG